MFLKKIKQSILLFLFLFGTITLLNIALYNIRGYHNNWGVTSNEAVIAVYKNSTTTIRLTRFLHLRPFQYIYYSPDFYSDLYYIDTSYPYFKTDRGDTISYYGKKMGIDYVPKKLYRVPELPDSVYHRIEYYPEMAHQKPKIKVWDQLSLGPLFD